MSNELQVSTSVFSLVPKTMEEAFKMAEMMAASDFVPKAYQGKPGNVLVAVQMGQEIGLKPMQAVQNIAVINGKPGIYGDAGKAILLAAGCGIEEDDVEVVKKNGKGRCVITRPGRLPVERTFSIDDAKTANLWGKEGPWKTYPYRQMAWRAFWFAARDAASDLLKGLDGIEAISDTQAEKEINPAPRRQTGAQAAEQAKQQQTTQFDPEERAALVTNLEKIATEYGTDAYAETWSKLTKQERHMVGADEHARLKVVAASIAGDASETIDQETGEVTK